MKRGFSISIIGFGFFFLTGFSPQIALPTFQGAQASSQSDTDSPIITITASDGSSAIANNSITNDATIALTFTANENVTGFAVGDIGAIGGSLSSFSGSNATYTSTFTPSGDRNTAIYISKEVYTDESSNNNINSIPFYWTYDGTLPVYISGTYITADNSKVKIRLSETVYDTNGGTGALETGDFTLSISGGSATLGSVNPTAITKDRSTFSSATLDNNLSGAFGLEIVDLDFDGDMDVVATAIDGDDINWYENDGSENFTERSIVGNLNGALGLAINDVDGDGDLDIFATAFNGGTVEWFENNGSQSFTKSTIGTLGAAYDVMVNDLDGDGDMDVIASGRSGNKVVWYANDGSQSFTENEIDNSIDGPANFDVKDIDGDGDLDLMVAVLDANDVVFYQNDGSENFTKNTIDSNLPAARDVIIADIDGDGDYDAVATSSNDTGNDLVWYANDGSGNFTSNVIGDDINFTNYLQVADIDGDNDQDILVTMFNARDLIWYENDGSQNFNSNTIENNLNGIAEVKVADVDGDGDLDAVVTGRNADDVVFYTNSDSGYVLDISLTGTPDGTETLTILPTSTSIYDLAGNAASTSQSNSTVTLNDLRPTMAITAVNGSSSAVSDGSTTNDATLTVTFTSSGSTSDFVVGDVTVSGGALSSFSGSGTTYTATFTPSANGATTIDVAAGAFTDASGYSNAAATQFNWTYDSVGPLITITATDGSNAVANNSITNDATLTVTFTANETVTGFAVGDVGAVGGSLSSFSGSGTTYTATFTPSSDRNTMIYIPAAGFTDAATNNNLASIPFYWTKDGTAPVYISGTYVTGNNGKVKVRLSETVYDTNGGAGALETGDFTLSISGGSATLGSTNPTAITKDTPTFSAATIDNNLGSAQGLQIADLDFDGDEDIIACGKTGDDLNWYESDGSGSYTERLIDGNLNGAQGIAVNDIDGDGDLDIFATARDGDQVALYTNNGSQSFTKTVIDSDLIEPHHVECTDLNDDGYMDIIATGRGSDKIIWYSNDGSQNFTENVLRDDLNGAITFFISDVDEDGDKDIIVAELDGGKVAYLSNNGSESFTNTTIASVNRVRAVSAADLDGDGDIDLAATGDNSSGNEVVWFENDGSENFTAIAIESSIGSANHLQIVDIDGDNDKDVIVTSYQDDDVLWYENDGSQNFTKSYVDNNLNGSAYVKVDDMDGDGDLDIVATGQNANDVMVYTNSDSGYVLDISLSGTPDGTETLTILPTSTSIYDFVGNAASTSQSNSTVTLNDLRPTIAITAVNGSSSAVSDGSTTNDATLTVTFTSSASTSNFVVGDLTVSGGALSSFSGSGTTYTATFTPTADGATTIDVAAGTFTDASGYSSAAATQFNWTYDGTSPYVAITATDGSNAVANNSITNDATLSLTFTANESVTGFAIGDIGTFGGSVSSFSGSGSSYTATFTPSGERNTGIYLPKDTYTDIATNNNRGSLPFYWSYDATAPTIVSGTSVASDNSTVTVKLSEPVYDTNSGSGALEVGDFAFSISGGSATLASTIPTSISKANSSFTARTIGTPNGPVDITYYDLDLDNDIDIIVPLNPGSKLIWYENNGSQSFTENTIDASVTSPREAWPVDLDLDGDIDIIQAVEGADALVWYENNGSQSFTKNTIDGSPGGSARSVSVEDIDEDGDLDISLTTYSSSNFYWYENNGSQSFTRRTISTVNVLFPILIDLDEDGDFDFVSHINDGSDKIGWYENDGSENFTENIIANDYGAQIAVADLDEDGDYDVIGADYTNGHINWYENNGSESFTKNTIDNSDMTNAWDVKVGDVDGDGDLDVVGMASTNNSTADDKIVLYINNGSEAFTEFIVDDDLNRPYKFRMTDIDNDGDLDMMVGSRDEDKVIWYENVDAGYVLGLSLSGTPSGAETVTVTPASSAIFDVAGNAASTSQSNNTVTLNNQRITMAITAVNGSSSAVSDGSTTNDATLTVTFTSSASTTNFAVGDVTVSGGSLSSFSGSGTTYTATFTPSSNGATTIDVAGGTFTDASGNNNSAATQFNWTYDSTVPTITGSSLASDNSTIAVTFSEAVYNTNGGSGSLQVSDFVFSISGGSATLSSTTPSSISVSSNTYTLGISLSGTANGSETITVTPVTNSIYDIAGNVASTSQSNNTVTLNDKTGPTMAITASNGMVLIPDGSTTNNSTISITFTSSESTSNLVVGDVTVSGGSLSSFSGSGTTYTATFTPSSNGATTIDVAGGTFTDASGNNNSAATQFNWTYDSTAPTITGNSLASDNSTIAVTFSEAVYNTNGGSGSLQVSDFVFSISGGSATLSSTTPSSISVSSNTYTLGISLSGTANGSETITVNPVTNSIYDIAGNVASTSQSNNTVSLNAVVTNYVLDLDGSNEAAYVNDDPAFESTDLSIQVWVDPGSLPSSGNQEWFVNKNRVYRIGLENNGGTTKIMAEFRDGSGNYEDLQGTTLSDASGGWYHIVFTFDDSSNRIRLYVNGSEVASKSHNSSTVNNNARFSIGRRDDTNAAYYDGKIDEVAYWNTELSASAISALYNSGTPLSASSNSGNYTSSGNLVMYYQFQENLNDSEGSFNLTGRNIGSSDYTAETIE